MWETSRCCTLQNRTAVRYHNSAHHPELPLLLGRFDGGDTGVLMYPIGHGFGRAIAEGAEPHGYFQAE